MRMFVALVPPAEVLEDLAAFLAPRQEAETTFRWSSPEQWHITLAFMPAVPERVLDDLLERLTRAAARRSSFTVRAAGGGAFPNPARARVLYAGVEAGDPQELRRLATGARAAAAKAGAGTEGGRFHPHLTLARAKRPVEMTRWIRVLDAYRDRHGTRPRPLSSPPTSARAPANGPGMSRSGHSPSAGAPRSVRRMRVGVLGTGMVGRTLAPAFAGLGHDVVVGTRDPAATHARTDWPSDLALREYALAAETADLVVNATHGQASLSALAAVGSERLAGRVVLDVANPLDFSRGFPPTLAVKDTDSLAEQIQRAFPDARVVKALNTVSCEVMVDPGRVGDGGTTMFAAGNDAEARAVVVRLLRALGWRDVIEFEQLSAARGMEMWLPLWVRLMERLGTADFNLALVRSPAPGHETPP